LKEKEVKKRNNFSTMAFRKRSEKREKKLRKNGDEKEEEGA